jgi:indole-3-glycerol phosphate synthase
VDVNTSLKLIEKIPDQSLKISESGISDPELVIQLIQAGFHGFLIGETFMKEKDPGSSLHHFIARLQKPIIS